MQKALVILGLAIFIIGLAWPWLSQLPFGRLPGDIQVEKEGFRFYFPITTMIVVSVVLSIVVWLWRQ